MSGRVGSITTDIIADGLLTNFDASNLASTTPSSATTIIKNTINLDNNGTFGSSGIYDATNKCFNWDGSTNMQLDTAISLGTEYSYCAWMNPTAWNGEPIGGNTVGSKYMMYITSTQWYHNVGGVYILINHGLSLSSWNYFCFTRNNLVVTTYVNGTQISTGTLGANTAMTNAIRNFGTETGANYYYNGKQDNMNLYNRALSSDEILHNYNALKDRH